MTDTPRQRPRHRPPASPPASPRLLAAGLALAGAGTGLVNALLMDLDGWPTQLLGVVFGLPVAAILWRAGLATGRGAAVVTVAFGLSWRLAVELAARIQALVGPLAVAGIAAGALGAGIVALGLWLGVPALRRRGAMVVLTALGGALGALLGVEPFTILFVAWQGGIALAIGLLCARR